MSIRPLTQTPAEVRALLDGKRTGFTLVLAGAYVHPTLGPPRPSVWPGDLLWVRESCRITVYASPGTSFARFDVPDTTNPPRYTPRAFFRKGGAPVVHGHSLPRNAIQMPRAASRLTLEVVDAHFFAQLQDMPHDFMVAEGLRRISKDGMRTWKFGMGEAVDGLPGSGPRAKGDGMPWRDWSRSLPEAYARWLEQRYSAGIWAANPPALFVEARVHRENIDHMLARLAREAAAERAA